MGGWYHFHPLVSMADSCPLQTALKIASHNTQGLNSPTKRRKAFQSYNYKGIDIILLQETHFPNSYTLSFLHNRYPTFFLANADDKKRGIAILFSKRTSFAHSLTSIDKEGRYILVKGTMAGKLYTIKSYYAPNRGQAKFFSSMVTSLFSHFEGRVFMGGDSNITFDKLLYRSAQGIPHLKKPPSRVSALPDSFTY